MRLVPYNYNNASEVAILLEDAYSFAKNAAEWAEIGGEENMARARYYIKCGNEKYQLAKLKQKEHDENL